MTNKLTALIVDDEPLARGLLRANLQDLDSVEIIAECKNGKEALARNMELNPDIMFLDIHMPGLNGVEVVKAIQADIMPMIVFTTAYEKYAIEAFDLNAVDYLLKPIEEHQVARAVDRALKRNSVAEQNELRKQQLMNAIETLSHEVPSPSQPSDTESKKLAIKDGRQIDMVDIQEIDWVDAAGDLMCVHSSGTTYLMRSTMKNLMQQLNSASFQRIHRSTIVNLNRIQKIVPHIKGEYFVYLDCGTKLKVSRGFKDVINDYLADC